jgi:hypothetical protein
MRGAKWGEACNREPRTYKPQYTKHYEKKQQIFLNYKAPQNTNQEQIFEKEEWGPR